jgi:hypothetical protein
MNQHSLVNNDLINPKANNVDHDLSAKNEIRWSYTVVFFSSSWQYVWHSLISGKSCVKIMEFPKIPVRKITIQHKRINKIEKNINIVSQKIRSNMHNINIIHSGGNV